MAGKKADQLWLLGVVSLASAWLAFCLAVPGRIADPGVKVASGAIGAIGLLALGALVAVLITGAGPPDRGWNCALHLGLVALAPGALLVLMLRRAAPWLWVRTGLAVGLASAGLGAFSLQFACGATDPMHLLAWHALPGVFFVALTVAAARRVWPRG